MIKRLTTHGNSLALVIERPILKLLRIDPETPLEIATDGKNLIISPVRDSKRKLDLRTALAKVNRRQ